MHPFMTLAFELYIGQAIFLGTWVETEPVWGGGDWGPPGDLLQPRQIAHLAGICPEVQQFHYSNPSSFFLLRNYNALYISRLIFRMASSANAGMHERSQ